MAALSKVGAGAGLFVGSADRKEKKPSKEEIIAAEAKWNSIDPDLIASLGKGIIISGNLPPKSNYVLGLSVKPGSTLAEIKPLFDARIQELTRRRNEAQEKYNSLQRSYDLMEMAAATQPEFAESGITRQDVFKELALPKEGTLDQQNACALRCAQYQTEIDELTTRFKPALDVYTILQRA